MTSAIPMLADPIKRPAPTGAGGDYSAKEPMELIKAVPTPDDAVRLAWVDIRTIHPDVRCQIRYVYLPMGHTDGRVKRVGSLVVNYIHRASTTVLPIRLPGGYLLRIDLASLAPQYRDYIEFKRFWEELRYDPSFAENTTKDQLDASGYGGRGTTQSEPEWRIEWKTIDHKGGKLIVPGDYPYTPAGYEDAKPGRYKVQHYYLIHKPGESSSQEGYERRRKVDVIRDNSPGIDPISFCRLQEETQSLAPVVDVRYLGHRAMRTIKEAADSGIKGVDTNVYKTIFGGLYYEFAGVRLAQDVFGRGTKVTDLDLFLQDVGAGSVGEKVRGKQRGVIKVEDLFNQLRSDQSAITLRSGVTDKPRDTTFLETNSGDGSITGDVFDESIDIGDRVFRNYLQQRVQAREGIFWKQGIPGRRLNKFGLWNGAGKRVNVVPPNVAANRRTPHPSTTQLQAGMDCIGCHNIEGQDGYQPVRNDVHLLTLNTDIFGDARRSRGAVSFNQITIFDHKGRRFVLDRDTVDRIAGKYKGDFSERIAINRMWLMRATLKATYDGWEEDDRGQWQPVKDRPDPANVNICKVSALQLEETVGQYWWRGIDTKQALMELGLDVPKSQVTEVFKRLLPPDRRNAIFDEHGNPVFIQEDPVVAGLAAGATFNRSDFALSYPRMAERAVRSPLYRQLRTRKTR